MLNSSRRKIAISWIYRLDFWAGCSQRAPSITGVIFDGRPSGTGGNLALPNNRKFFRMLVTEHSLHFATLAIWDLWLFSYCASCRLRLYAVKDRAFVPFCGGLGGFERLLMLELGRQHLRGGKGAGELFLKL
jgi:hypothetical protein